VFAHDWDGDGHADLLAGRRGDIVWYRNTSKKGSPELREPEIFVPASEWSFGSERRDDLPARLHAICVTDFNADGRLDLLLGDHFFNRVDLTKKQEVQVAEGMTKSSTIRRELATAPANETRPTKRGQSESGDFAKRLGSGKPEDWDSDEPGAYVDLHEVEGRVERVDQNHVKYFFDLSPGEKRFVRYSVTYKRRKVGPELNTGKKREPL